MCVRRATPARADHITREGAVRALELGRPRSFGCSMAGLPLLRMRRLVENGRLPLLCALLALAPATAGAQAAADSATSERASLQAARDHMERGQELYAASQYLEAAEAFLAAYDARPFSAFLFNAGVAYERYGDARKAVRSYQRYLEREPDAPDAAEVRAKINALVAALEAAGESLEEPETPPGETTPTETPAPGPAETPPGTPPAPQVAPGAVHVEGPVEEMKSLLSITTEPAGARVRVTQGDRVVAAGPAPFAETLEEGDYRVVVEHPDYRAVEQNLRVRPGKVYVVIVEMSQGQFFGFLRVVSDPPGAAVYVDDRAAGSHGQTPFQNPIPTGEHRVWIERAGYAPEERTVEVGLGEQVTVDATLARVTYGRLRVVANVEGATVYIDGDRAGSVPYEGEVEAGEHEITVSARGMKDWEEDVTIERGQLTPIRVRLRDSVSRGGAWGMLTLGALAAGGGAVLGVMSRNLEDDLARDRAAGILASDDERIRRGRWFAIGADASFGLGGFLGLLSIFYFVRDPLPDSEGRVLEPRDWAFVPVLDPFAGTAGLDVRGRF